MAKSSKDWDAIIAELDDDDTPKEDMNEFFQKLYANGDEATRRAMIKSYQTSGGTVLSTNWQEVVDKDYEDKDRPSPPPGQKYVPADKL